MAGKPRAKKGDPQAKLVRAMRHTEKKGFHRDGKDTDAGFRPRELTVTGYPRAASYDQAARAFFEKQRTGRIVNPPRRTPHDALSLACMPPGVPDCPETIDYIYRGRLPDMAKLQGLLLDEQKFMEKADLEETVENSMATMSARELDFAQRILNGSTASDAYARAFAQLPPDQDSKKAPKTTRTTWLNAAGKIRRRKDVQAYLSACIRLSHLNALEQVSFSDAEWLDMQRQLLAMAMGIVKTPKAYFSQGKPVECEVKDACLGVASRTLETVARHYGWLNDRMEVKTDGAVVTLKDFTRSVTDSSDDEDNAPAPEDDIAEGEFVVSTSSDDDESCWL